MRYKKGDFHMHSTVSDGALTPSQVVAYAKKRGVDIIALTDHNNTDGVEEAINKGKEIGVRVIPGVELSTRYEGTRVHVLGYFKDDRYKDPILRKVLNNVKNHKISAVKEILGDVLNFRDKKSNISVEAGIEILKHFGATVILAHPVFLSDSDFNDIIRMNFDGLEAKYFSNWEKDTEYFLEVAKQRNLLYTAGSDFHRPDEMYRSHGMIGDVFLDETEIYNFLTGAGIKYE